MEPGDYALLASALAANRADFQTTRAALSGGGVEHNPLMRTSPSKSALTKAEIGTTLGILGIGLGAPKEFRTEALAGITGMKAALAHQNKKGRQFSGFADAMKKPIAIGLASALLAHHFLNDPSVSVGPGALGPLSIKYEKKF